jgi:hypothetical protein
MQAKRCVATNRDCAARALRREIAGAARVACRDAETGVGSVRVGPAPCNGELRTVLAADARSILTASARA